MKRVKTILTSVLAYLFLVIDRLVLVPFPFLSSRSAADWDYLFKSSAISEQKAANKQLIFAIFRVSAFIISLIITLLLIWLI